MKEKLGEIFEIGSGGTPSKAHPEYYGGEIPWVKTGDLKGEYLYDVEDCITEAGLKNSSAKIYESDTVLIAMYGATIGATSILKFPACTNQACAAFKKSDLVLPEFLYYFLKSQKTKFIKDGIGGAQPNISVSYLKQVEMDLCSIAEQKKIIDALDVTSHIITAYQQQLQKLDELVKARFVEMFGDIRTNNKELKTAKGSELFKFSSGKFLPEGKRKNAGIPVYGGNGIAWYTDEPLIDYPTIIVGRVGAQCGNIHFVNVPVWITDNAIYIKKQKTDLFTLEFLTEMMTVIDFSQFADFSGQPKITQKPLENTEYLIPTIEEQKAFSAFCKQVDKSKVAVQKALDEAQLLFDSLMQKYFG